MVFLEPQVPEDQPNINRERPVGVGFVLWVNIGLVINQLEQSSRQKSCFSTSSTAGKYEFRHEKGKSSLSWWCGGRLHRAHAG